MESGKVLSTCTTCLIVNIAYSNSTCQGTYSWIPGSFRWSKSTTDGHAGWAAASNLIGTNANQRSSGDITCLLDRYRSNIRSYGFLFHDFFLNETLAQLQLAMFGLSDEFQEKTNTKIRKAFSGENMGYAKEFAFSLLNEVKTSKGPLSCPMSNDFGKKT